MDRFRIRLRLLAEGRLVEALQYALAVPADKALIADKVRDDGGDVPGVDVIPQPQLFSPEDAQQSMPSAGAGPGPPGGSACVLLACCQASHGHGDIRLRHAVHCLLS